MIPFHISQNALHVNGVWFLQKHVPISLFILIGYKLLVHHIVTWKRFAWIRDGGMKGLFTGIGPRVGRAGPSVGIVVSFYEVVKYALHHRHLTQWARRDTRSRDLCFSFYKSLLSFAYGQLTWCLKVERLKSSVNTRRLIFLPSQDVTAWEPTNNA